MDPHEIATWIVENADSDGLRKIADALACRLQAHRTTAGGLTPSELYEPVLAIAGVYVSIDLAIQAHDQTGSKGFAFKKRGDQGEVGWLGQYQIVGSSVGITGREGAYQRLATKIHTDVDRGKQLIQGSRELGLIYQWESERRALCVTIQHHVRVSHAEFAEFSGVWRIVPVEQISSDNTIIDLHRRRIPWILDPLRLFQVDLP
jgi:hypothetical protein